MQATLEGTSTPSPPLDARCNHWKTDIGPLGSCLRVVGAFGVIFFFSPIFVLEFSFARLSSTTDHRRVGRRSPEWAPSHRGAMWHLTTLTVLVAAAVGANDVAPSDRADNVWRVHAMSSGNNTAPPPASVSTPTPACILHRPCVPKALELHMKRDRRRCTEQLSWESRLWSVRLPWLPLACWRDQTTLAACSVLSS